MDLILILSSIGKYNDMIIEVWRHWQDQACEHKNDALHKRVIGDEHLESK